MKIQSLSLAVMSGVLTFCKNNRNWIAWNYWNTKRIRHQARKRRTWRNRSYPKKIRRSKSKTYVTKKKTKKLLIVLACNADFTTAMVFCFSSSWTDRHKFFANKSLSPRAQVTRIGLIDMTFHVLSCHIL